MKFTRISLGVVSVVALLASAANAEVYFISQEQAEPAQSDVVSQKDVVQGDSVVVQKDVVQSESVVQKADVCGCDVACGGCCDAGCGCDPCCCPAPWELWPRGCSGLKIGGWTQFGYHTEGANGFGTGMFNDYPNVAQLHQAYLVMGKAAQNCGCGFDWGFQLDYIYGTDGPDAQAIGSVPGNWDNSWDGGGAYGHALPQAYAEVAYNNFNVKAGKFYSILGYERVPAVQNFFYSHAFAMLLPNGQIQPKIATLQPYTHTGFLTEYQANCQLTVYGGWTAGWDTGFDQYGQGGDTFLGGFSYAARDNMTVDYSVIMGDFGQIDQGALSRTSDSDGYLHSIVVDYDVNCRLKCIVQSNYGDNGQWFRAFNAAGAPVAGNGKVFSLSNYLLYTLNCQWALGSRMEWLKIGGTDEYANVTIGANYRPCANVILRPEFRMDEFNGAGVPVDQASFGVDAIITF